MPRRLAVVVCLLVSASIVRGQGPILRYTFDDGTATDVTGNGRSGTVAGSPSFVSGALGQGIFLNNPTGFGAATEYVSIPNSLSASLNSASFTVALLMRSTDTSQQNGRLFGNNFSSAGMAMGYNRDTVANASILLRDNVPSGPGFFDATAGPEGYVTDGNWHWMVLVVDRTANQARAYIDGNSQSASIAGLGATSFDNLRIGSVTNAGDVTGTAFGAKLTTVDDFQIFDRALSDAEVLSTFTPVPEPTAVALVGAAGLAVVGWGRRRLTRA